MELGLRRTTDASVEPLTLTQAKKQVELAAADASHDTHLTRLIKTARIVTEHYCRAAWITQSWTLTLDRFPTTTIVVPRGPLQSVTSISYVDSDGNGQTLSSGVYRVGTGTRPGRIELAYNQSWPTTRSVIEAVTVVYVAGYGAAASNVPGPVVDAMLMLIDHWFNHRGPVLVGSSSLELPWSVRALLDPYRQKVYAGCYGRAD